MNSAGKRPKNPPQSSMKLMEASGKTVARLLRFYGKLQLGLTDIV